MSSHVDRHVIQEKLGKNIIILYRYSLPPPLRKRSIKKYFVVIPPPPIVILSCPTPLGMLVTLQSRPMTRPVDRRCPAHLVTATPSTVPQRDTPPLNNKKCMYYVCLYAFSLYLCVPAVRVRLPNSPRACSYASRCVGTIFNFYHTGPY